MQQPPRPAYIVEWSHDGEPVHSAMTTWEGSKDLLSALADAGASVTRRVAVSGTGRRRGPTDEPVTGVQIPQ